MTAPTIHVFEHHAMATYFHVRVAGGDARYARQAAQECFRLVDRLEGLLSRYDEGSEIAAINRLPPGGVLRISLETVECLQQAFELHELTGGAFDPTLGRVLDHLRGGQPATDAAGARGRLLLDPSGFVVQVADAPVSLDLGAIGKGFALDRAAGLLREWEIESALLVSGGSSILALAGPEPGRGWEVNLDDTQPDGRLLLEHSSISSSGTTVKGEHIIDPLTGQPAHGPFRTWALAESAAVSDALSTAWMSLTREEIAEVCRLRPGVTAVLQAVERGPLVWVPSEA